MDMNIYQNQGYLGLKQFLYITKKNIKNKQKHVLTPTKRDDSGLCLRSDWFFYTYTTYKLKKRFVKKNYVQITNFERKYVEIIFSIKN